MSTHAKHQYRRNRATLSRRRYATGEHGPSAIAAPLYIRHPEIFSTVGKAQKLIAEHRTRGEEGTNAHRRFGLSHSQFERLCGFCRSSAYGKLANRA